MENNNIDQAIMQKKDELNALLSKKQELRDKEEIQNIIRVGLLLRDLRNKKKFSQETLAEKSNVAPGTISRIERGVQEPSYSVLRSLIKTLQLSPDEICRLFDC